MSILTEQPVMAKNIDLNKSLGSHKTVLVPNPVLDAKREVVAFLGAGVVCVGEIWYEGNVQIDGNLEGNVHTKGTLLIGQQAKIKGAIEAGTVVCQGNISGQVVAKEKVNLISPGSIDGTLTTPTISVETGGRFNGHVLMNRQSSGKPA